MQEERNFSLMQIFGKILLVRCLIYIQPIESRIPLISHMKFLNISRFSVRHELLARYPKVR